MSVGFSLSGFEVIDKLGEGGMATVWKARQVSLDRTVAIKILASRMASDPDDVERFQNEARSAARLKHPGIVQVYDANAENDLYYFVMEFVDGYTAGEWVRRKGRLSESDALLVADCVADALGYAWQREGIIHCDIKPDNIMIDADGSVKVADLGLARTISSMQPTEASDEIMGTPAYISPEQAQGLADLDCRVDIYSLGAMLYHLVTGTMMFEGCREDEQLESHVDPDAYSPDPGELNTELSPGLCWLIERMTAKDPELRESDWDAVRADIARVRSGHLPHGEPLPEGASSVGRSTRRTAATHQRTVLRQKTSAAAVTPFARILLILGTITAAVAGGIFYQSQRGPSAAPGQVSQGGQTPGGGPPSTVSSGVDPYEERARLAFEAARAYFRANPDDYEGATQRFSDVITDATGTRYARRSSQAMAEVAAKRKADMELAKQALSRQLAPLVESSEFDQAIELVEAYNGAFSAELMRWRQTVVASLRSRIEQQAAEQRRAEEEAQAVFAGIVEQTVAALLRRDGATARELLLDYIASTGGQGAPEADELLGVVDGAVDINRRILDSLELQVGQTVTLQFATGSKEVLIERVDGNQVECKHIIDPSRYLFASFSFTVADLSARERLTRMGSESDYSVALAKGVMALGSQAYDHARNYLGMTHPLIAAALVEGVGGIEGGKRDAVAREALLAMLRGYGCAVSGQEHDMGVWAAAVRAHRFDRSLATRVRDSVEGYRRAYVETDFAAAAAPVLQALEAAFGGVALPPQVRMTPAPQGFGEAPGAVVAPAPVDAGPMSRLELAPMLNRPERVHAALLARNPGAAAEGVRYLEEGDARHEGPTLWITDGAVKDLEPIRALTSLRHFIYRPQGGGRGQLSDLAPLADLRIKSLELDNCEVRDLSALARLYLTTLVLEDVPVSDLLPVRHGSLERFVCQGTDVRDFSSLNGAPITTLVMDHVPPRFLFSLPKIRSVNGEWLEEDWREEWHSRPRRKPVRR